MKRHINIYMALALCVGLASCNDFLDKTPDNRTSIDTEDKVVQILVNAYPSTSFNLFCEYLSDDVDEYENTYTNAFLDEIYQWKDPTETNNDSPQNFWSAAYDAATSANYALQGIEDLGGATTQTLRECKGEALIARAYAHFVLVNVFSLNYNSATSDTDLGVPYMKDQLTEVGTVRERGSVAETYANIARDIEEGLPLVGDSHLNIPKYHFNRLAAYAFATRFYLYYEKWEKAIECANVVLGTNPKAMLRDWNDQVTNYGSDREVQAEHYVSSELNCNLLLCSSRGYLGRAFSNSSYYKKYTHGPYVASAETALAQNIFGTNTDIVARIHSYNSSGYYYNIFYRVPNLFEYTDAVAGTGYRATVFPLFTADECLLNRAEAYIMAGQYDNAAADLTTWMQNFTTSTETLTPQSIQAFYNARDYSYEDGMESTIKKHLHPAFTIAAEGSVQEAMLQCVLGFRRLETMPFGLRWFDIKRYGIEYPRRKMSAAGGPETQTDFLSKDDLRRAVQIPLRVRQAGMTPNPR